MVAKDGDCTITVIVEFSFGVCCIFNTKLIVFTNELLLKCDWGIISSENFCWKVVHEVFQKLVEPTGINPVEYFILLLFGRTKWLQELIHDRFHLDCVVVTHTVLSQKVKSYLAVDLKLYMLNSQRAAADRICFILTFLITHAQGKLINQIGADAKLVIG